MGCTGHAGAAHCTATLVEGPAQDPRDICKWVYPHWECTWSQVHKDWDHRDWAQCSPELGLGLVPDPLGTCTEAHPPGGYTWSLDHRGWAHRDSAGAGVWSFVWGQEKNQGRCLRTHRNNRGPSWDSQGRQHPPTNRCCGDLGRRLVAVVFGEGNCHHHYREDGLEEKLLVLVLLPQYYGMAVEQVVVVVGRTLGLGRPEVGCSCLEDML